MTLGTGGSPGVDMVDATQEVGGGVGLGWGGVGMITFLALAHMVGATQHHLSCTCTHGRCYATSSCLYLHTWSVLRNIIFLALAHLVAAMQHHWNLPSLLYILIVSIIFCKSSEDILLVNPMCANFEFRHTLQHQMFGFSIGTEVQVESLKNETCDASTFVFDFFRKLVADSKEGLWHVTIFFLTIIIFIITIIFLAS